MYLYFPQMNGYCTGVYFASFFGERGGLKTINALLPEVDEHGVHRVMFTEEHGIVENDKYSGAIGMNKVSADMMIETSFCK